MVSVTLRGGAMWGGGEKETLHTENGFEKRRRGRQGGTTDRAESQGGRSSGVGGEESRPEHGLCLKRTRKNLCRGRGDQEKEREETRKRSDGGQKKDSQSFYQRVEEASSWEGRWYFTRDENIKKYRLWGGK